MKQFMLPGIASLGLLVAGCASTGSSGAHSHAATSPAAVGESRYEAPPMAPSVQVTTVSHQPVNTVCPIMGGEVQAEGGSATWNGKTIGFCCKGCVAQWEKLNESQKAQKLVSTRAPGQERLASTFSASTGQSCNGNQCH